ncbi:MAG: exopolysaccharide biosynthesis polyprenyl glycosylphosphotransferase [Caulobacteraceae bacterium]|nr:exopolysaccharide biosynthesis polyprenyl glycosylphosphotransferase [Caulobacteraceae bacterium]
MMNAMDLDRAAVPSDAPPGRGRLDATGLKALTAQAVTVSSEDGAGRRGPFRPEVWLSARQRHAARLAVHWFRTADIAAVALITLALMALNSPGGLLLAPVSAIVPLATAALVLLGLIRSLGLYRFSRDQGVLLTLAVVVCVTAVGGITALALDLVLAGGANSAACLIWIGMVGGSLCVLHTGWSGRITQWRREGTLTPNIVLVGATRHAEALIRDALQRRDLNVLGVFDDRLARSPDSLAGVPVLGDAAALMTHRMTPYVDRIVLAIDPRAEQRVRELTARLSTLPNEVTLLVDPVDDTERLAALDRLARPPLAAIGGTIDPDQRAFNKRLQDLLIGTLALVLLSPVILLTAVAIRLDSPGPIFFRQRRHGFNQEEIVVWKFRSMRHEAADATASRQVTSDDDRVTRVGRIIRSTSLDELPQLFNVLKGEMSLVGPRPHAIGMKTGETESALLVAEYAHRHRMKPGMTGWAAIKGSRGPLHNAHDVRRRVQLDVEYIERQSLWLDLWIMAVTLPVLLGDRAAVR